MNHIETHTNFDKFVLVNLAFSAYSGLVTLDKGAMGNNIDPKLITAGDIKTVARDHLKVFGTLKSQARTICLRYGTSFMGGYAIPVDKWSEVQSELLEVKSKYEQEAVKFVANYTDIVKEWANAHPSDEDLIIQKAHSADWIKDRFDANFFGCTLSPASGMEDSMNDAVEGMFESICKDLAIDAKQAIRAYQKGSKITCKMRSTFEGMIEKINALSFINPSLTPLGKTIEKYIDDLLPENVKGKIEEDRQGKIAILLIAMSEPNNLSNLADILEAELQLTEKVINQTANDTQSSPKPFAAPAASEDESESYSAGFTLM